MRLLRRIDRRDFLKQCGFLGLAVGAVGLAGCESTNVAEQDPAPPAPTSFFADGTDFAD
jgi:hypothetical protein